MFEMPNLAPCSTTSPPYQIGRGTPKDAVVVISSSDEDNEDDDRVVVVESSGGEEEVEEGEEDEVEEDREISEDEVSEVSNLEMKYCDYTSICNQGNSKPSTTCNIFVLPSYDGSITVSMQNSTYGKNTKTSVIVGLED